MYAIQNQFFKTIKIKIMIFSKITLYIIWLYLSYSHEISIDTSIISGLLCMIWEVLTNILSQLKQNQNENNN